MTLRLIDPKEDPAWDERLLRSGDHSFFHSAGWARVLEEAYGFKPVYFARLEDGRLHFLMPMMEVSGVLRGRRGVSLPFSDRCAPFAEDPESVLPAALEAIEHGKTRGWRSVEWRDDRYGPKGAPYWGTYLVHEIGLRKTEESLFRSLSPGNRRNVRKAVREGVTVRIEQSPEAMRSFYRLNCMTRRRHGLPPQPYVFFKSILEHVLSRDHGRIFAAYHSGRMIAASVFFDFGTEALFKYGASEPDRRRLRPNNLIMWEAMKWYNRKDFLNLSLGRTEPANPGLLRFKRTFGADERPLRYLRFDLVKGAYAAGRPRGRDPLRPFFSRIPSWVLRIIGRLFYRQFG